MIGFISEYESALAGDDEDEDVEVEEAQPVLVEHTLRTLGAETLPGFSDEEIAHSSTP